MKCLVTGISGFIGNNLAKRLLSKGHEVRGLLHDKEGNLENIEYITGDITDVDSLKFAVEDVDVIFHCAALVKDYGPKELFNKINFEGTKNIAHISSIKNIKRFVFLSTIRTTEPVGWYGRTKALAEDHLMKMHREENFPVTILRPGDVYGPGAKLWVLRVLKAIKKGRIALINEGEGIFHHLYIDNLMDAMLLAMEKKEAVGEIFDITDGDNEITWNEYLNELARMAGKPRINRSIPKKFALLLSKAMLGAHHLFKIEPLLTPMAVEIFSCHREISIQKAERLLGYKPSIELREGMKRVENWLLMEGYID